VAFGGAGELGYRATNWIGIAAGISRQPHDRAKRVVLDPISGDELELIDTGHLTSFDFAIARLYWPLDGRFQPYADVGGGLAVLEPPDPQEAVLVGGHVRGSVGFDAWVARSVTLGAGVLYRASFVDDKIGSQLTGFVGLGLHW
jgi:hypothetical protein